MRSPILAALAAVLLGPVAVLATSKAYDVVPYGDGVAIQTSGGVGVTQYYRNTLDSLTAVSVWLGPPSTSGSYSVVVYDSAGGQIAHNTYQVDLPSQWGWVSIPLAEDAEPVRGRTYKVKVTRSAGEITFGYDPRNPYKYGKAVANGSSPSLDSLADLALRVEGLHDTIGKGWWGYQTCAGGDTHALSQRGVPAKAESAGVGTARIELRWLHIWPQKNGAFDFSSSDAEVAYAATTMGCRVIGLLDYTAPAKWVSSRMDSIWTHGDTTDTAWCECCPPLYLDSAATDSENYWYRYVQRVVAHYDSIDPDMINVWEIWNESNDTVTYWKVPSLYYPIGSDTVRDMSALYARLCVVAESAIRSVAPEDTVLIGSLVCLQTDVVPPRMNPVEMLGYCYEYGQGAGWTACQRTTTPTLTQDSCPPRSKHMQSPCERL